MAGKARPSLRKKTLENVMLSNLSVTDKECIKAVFEEADSIVRCKECKWGETDDADFPYQRFCSYDGCAWNNENHFCSYGERRRDG